MNSSSLSFTSPGHQFAAWLWVLLAANAANFSLAISNRKNPVVLKGQHRALRYSPAFIKICGTNEKVAPLPCSSSPDASAVWVHLKLRKEKSQVCGGFGPAFPQASLQGTYTGFSPGESRYPSLLLFSFNCNYVRIFKGVL